jgi:beta-galactosidase
VSTTFTIDGYTPTVALTGRDFKILAAGYDMERQHLVYSTSEIMAHVNLGDRDVALLHGRAGESGETVLRYTSRPSVEVVAGNVTSTWDNGDLRLTYVHNGLARVRIHGGGRPPLELLLADSDTASTFWRVDTNDGPILARGPYLVRSAEQHGTTLWLRGDAGKPSPLEVFAPRKVRAVYWNGTRVRAGTVPGPDPVALPSLTNWHYTTDTPEAAPAYDDSHWVTADHTTTNNPTQPATLPVLYTDDYGFHHGDVWYRGHFTATGTESQLSLTAGTGRAGVWTVWLNGTNLGTVNTGTASGNQNSSRTFTVPPELLRPGADNVVAVLVRNMGHNENGGSNDNHKAPRGLLAASLDGTALTWRIQGGRTDKLRGPLNNGGLHGERVGYPLPSFHPKGWAAVTLPHEDPAPGIAWYRTTVRLDLPRDQDVPVGLRFTDDPARHYRVLIFVNGWQVGQYVNDVGPQRVFTLPQGILHHQGENTIALAVWSTDAETGGLGEVTLTALGNNTTPIHVRNLPT